MAFAWKIGGILRAGIGSSSSSLQQQCQWRRLNSTLTTSKLFISGLSRLTTDEKLEEAFSPFGQLVEARVITDKASGRSKGFGFVKYAMIEDAEKAKEKMNATYLDGWVIFVDPAKPREPRPPPPSAQQQDVGVRSNKTIGWCG